MWLLSLSRLSLATLPPGNFSRVNAFCFCILRIFSPVSIGRPPLHDPKAMKRNDLPLPLFLSTYWWPTIGVEDPWMIRWPHFPVLIDPRVWEAQFGSPVNARWRGTHSSVKEHLSLLPGVAEERVWEFKEVLAALSEERNGADTFCAVQGKIKLRKKGCICDSEEAPFLVEFLAVQEIRCSKMIPHRTVF